MSINISSSIIIFNLIIILITMMIFMMQRSGSVSSLCGDGLGLPDHPFLLQCDVIPGNILNKYPPMWYPAISSNVIPSNILNKYPPVWYPAISLTNILQCDTRQYPQQISSNVIPGNIFPPPMWYPAISSTRICHHILLQYPKSGVDIITIQFPNWGPSSSSAPEMISMANNLFLTINQQEKSYLANFFFLHIKWTTFQVNNVSIFTIRRIIVPSCNAKMQGNGKI